MLVLTGVVVLIVSTTKIKRLSLEREKAVEVSQKIIDAEIKKSKDDPLVFWGAEKSNVSNSTDFPGYIYEIEYDCTITGNSSDNCNTTFTVNWGDNQTLSVKRFFSRQGI